MRGMFKGIIENRLFDLLRNPVGMRITGPRQTIQKALGPIGSFGESRRTAGVNNP